MGIKIEDGLDQRQARASSGSSGSGAPIRCTTSIRRSARRRGTTPGCRWSREGLIDAEHFWGTINCDGVNAEGRNLRRDDDERPGLEDPGRAGDSPILGAGLYVDGDVGAAGSTGRGEANLYNLSSFLIVEEMRRGAHPKDAAMTALQPRRQEHDREAAAERQGQPELRAELLLPEREGRIRRRRDVRVELRRLHRERAADAQDRRALRRTRHRLTHDVECRARALATSRGGLCASAVGPYRSR